MAIWDAQIHIDLNILSFLLKYKEGNVYIKKVFSFSINYNVKIEYNQSE